MIVLGGSAAGSVGKNLAKLIKAKYSAVELKSFSDGEFAVKVPFNAYGEDVVIVQSTYAPQERHLMELLFMADAVWSMKAKSICAVVPYLAYMRQNKSFTDGEAVSANVVMRLFNKMGIGRLVTVQLHKDEPLTHFEGKGISISPIRTLMKEVAGDLKTPFVLAPDKGSLTLAKLAASILKCDYTHIDKERDTKTGTVSIKNTPKERFDGKQVLIVDDMISTGGTIGLAANFAYSRGATEVAVAAVHLIMAEGAYNRMKQAGITRVYGTNTIPCSDAKTVDISGDIAAALKKG